MNLPLLPVVTHSLAASRTLWLIFVSRLAIRYASPLFSPSTPHRGVYIRTALLRYLGYYERALSAMRRIADDKEKEEDAKKDDDDESGGEEKVENTPLEQDGMTKAGPNADAEGKTAVATTKDVVLEEGKQRGESGDGEGGDGSSTLATEHELRLMRTALEGEHALTLVSVSIRSPEWMPGKCNRIDWACHSAGPDILTY